MLNQGSCEKPGCRYAHTSEELRLAPGLLKTKMCSFFATSVCVVGAACRFAHSPEELQQAQDVNHRAANEAADTAAAAAAGSGAVAAKNAAASDQAGVATADGAPKAKAAPSLYEQRRTAFHRGPAGEPAEQAQAPQTLPAPAVEAKSRAPAPAPPTAPAAASSRLRGGTVKVNPGLDRKDVIFRRVIADVEDVVRVHLAPATESGPKSRPRAAIVRIAAMVDVEDGDLPFAGGQRRPQHEGSPCTRRAPSRRVSLSVEALLDIEDVGTAMDPCQGCSNNPDIEESLVDRWRQAGESDGAALARRKKATTQGACGRQLRKPSAGDPLPQLGCPVCNKGGHGHQGQACAACNCGLKVIARNTFLTIAEDGGEEDGRAMRRTKSL